MPWPGGEKMLDGIPRGLTVYGDVSHELAIRRAGRFDHRRRKTCRWGPRNHPIDEGPVAWDPVVLSSSFLSLCAGGRVISAKRFPEFTISPLRSPPTDEDLPRDPDCAKMGQPTFKGVKGGAPGWMRYRPWWLACLSSLMVVQGRKNYCFLGPWWKRSVSLRLWVASGADRPYDSGRCFDAQTC